MVFCQWYLKKLKKILHFNYEPFIRMQHMFPEVGYKIFIYSHLDRRKSLWQGRNAFLKTVFNKRLGRYHSRLFNISRNVDNNFLSVALFFGNIHVREGGSYEKCFHTKDVLYLILSTCFPSNPKDLRKNIRISWVMVFYRLYTTTWDYEIEFTLPIFTEALIIIEHNGSHEGTTDTITNGSTESIGKRSS